MAKTMYVVQADDGMFYCGMKHWDKQLRKAKIYHSWDFADDIVSAYEECNCKIVEVSLAIVQKTNTNADRIRAMSDEELAKILNALTAYFEECNRSISDTDCHDCELCELCSLGEGKAVDWLKQPAEVSL